MTCPWCGYPHCEGTTAREPHHSLCCLDRDRAACWGERTPEVAAAAARAAGDGPGWVDPMRPTRTEAEAER